MASTFHVGVTGDFLKPDGSPAFTNIGLELLDEAPGVSWDVLPEATTELRPDQIRGYDALVVLSPRVTPATLADSHQLSLIARFGVGYDSVDVPACTEHGVLLTITPDGVRRPVATAVLALLLALSHRLPAKDRLTREGRWSQKSDYMGTGLTGRTLGVIGLGNIGREVFKLTRPLDMRHVAYDPFASAESAAGVGAELLGLDDLLRQSDFVAICCALSEETHHLLNAQRLALLKPTAYLINAARGPIVDQQALTHALQQHAFAGAGLDVFEQEPIDPQDPILKLDNVIVSPHALCWTDECFGGIGRSAIGSVLEVAAGRVPTHVVNRDALNHPALQHRLRGYAQK